MTYIWQRPHWPVLRWNSETLLPLISRARLAQGKLLTNVASLGFTLSREAHVAIVTEEALTTDHGRVPRLLPGP